MASSSILSGENYRYVAGSGHAEWRNMVDFHTKNFDDDPVLRYLFNAKPEQRRIPFVHRVIGVTQRMAARQDGIFDQVWTADEKDSNIVCAITWLRPGTSQDNPRYYFQTGMISMGLAAGLRGLKRMMYDWEFKDAQAKKIGLRRADGSRIKKYYYMAWVSTAVEARGQGLTPQLIKQFQERAAKDKMPIWTEASSPGSHRVYKRCGFQDVKILQLGKGSVDEKGYKKKGGPGVPLAILVWMPPEIYTDHK